MKKWLFISILMVCVVPWAPVTAQSESGPQVPTQVNGPELIRFQPAVAGLDLADCDAVSARTSFLACYISSLYTFLVQAAVILAVLMIVIGGFQYIFALGNQGKISEAKETIQVSIIGLVLALTSYLIFSLINPSIIDLRPLNITDISITPTAQNHNYGSDFAGLCSNMGGATPERCAENPWCLYKEGKCQVNYFAAQTAYQLYKQNNQSYRYLCCQHTTFDPPVKEIIAIPANLSAEYQSSACQQIVSPKNTWQVVEGFSFQDACNQILLRYGETTPVPGQNQPKE